MSSAMDDLRKKKAQADREAAILKKKHEAETERSEIYAAISQARREIGRISEIAGMGYSNSDLYAFYSDRSGMIFGRNTPANKHKAIAAEKVIELAAEFGYEAKLICHGASYCETPRWSVGVKWA